MAFVNTLEIHAREALGKPPEWKLTTYQSLPMDSRESTHFQLTGSIPSKVLFKSGPNKGKPNWKFSTDKETVIFSRDDHRAWEDAWEKRTGSCRDCGGDGQALSGYSSATGDRYRPCTRCARGKASP